MAGGPSHHARGNREQGRGGTHCVKGQATRQRRRGGRAAEKMGRKNTGKKGGKRNRRGQQLRGRARERAGARGRETGGEGTGGDDDRNERAQEQDAGAKAPETPRRASMTTLSDGGDRLTTWNQRGGGGRVQASRFWSLRRRFHLRLAPPKAEYAATDHKGPTTSRRTCFVPARARPSSVTSASDMPVPSTNFKCNPGNSDGSF